MKAGTFSDLGRRVATSIIGIACVAGVIFSSYHPYLKFIFALAVLAVAGIGSWEYVRIGQVKGFHLRRKLIVALSLLEVIAFYLASQSPIFSMAPLVLFFVAILVFFLSHFNETESSLAEIAISSFALLYIAIPMGMLFAILYNLSFEVEADGRWWIAYLIIVTKITDVGAYFCGKLLGKRKLAVSISPRKTIEGAIGGFICAMIASYCFSLISNATNAGFALGTTTALILGAMLGIVGQIGDLSESLFKRDAQVKDSNSLPGLGGILDTIDSLILNIPILYFFLSMV